MYDRTSFYDLLLAILPLLLAGVVYVDLRSRRGWGLALLALALMCYGLFLAHMLIFIQRHPGTDDLAGAVIFAVYLGIYLGLTLIVWIGALVEAGVSRQWRWLTGLVASALIPALVILAQVTLRLGLPGLNVISLGLTFAPAGAMLAYGIARFLRPVPRWAV